MGIDFDRVPRYIRSELDKGARVVKQDEKSKRVRRVQEWLCYHEFRTGIDGHFGPATRACVERFQRRARLAVTGSVNDATWKALVAPMREALEPPQGIGRLTPARVVRKVAEQHLKQHPVEIGGPNGGPWVRLYCEGNDGPPWAWCAGFVSLIVSQAYFYLGAPKTPIQGSVSCDTLAAQAREAGLFVAEADVTRARVAWRDFGGCCVFLRRRTDTDWVHAGFGLDADGPAEQMVFGTIEGNTNDEGSREGFEACRRTRSTVRGDYDFIRLP